MTNFNIIKIAAFTLLIGLVSCGKSLDVTVEKEYKGVDAALWSYFEKFETEAAKRGMTVDLTSAGITGSIERIHAHGTVGLCNHRLNEPNHVIIDREFWASASENSREMIIFHELGHCYLARGHKDVAKNDGTCASIMRSGNGGCVDFYTNSNKSKYLDELYTEVE